MDSSRFFIALIIFAPTFSALFFYLPLGLLLALAKAFPGLPVHSVPDLVWVLMLLAGHLGPLWLTRRAAERYVKDGQSLPLAGLEAIEDGWYQAKLLLALLKARKRGTPSGKPSE